jgi:Ca2+:H+ antiporter
LKTHAYLYDDTSTDTESEEQEVAEITPFIAILLLLASTAVVAVCAEFLVSAIDAMVASSGVSTTFIGLIVLPIVGNAAEVRFLRISSDISTSPQ